MEQQRQLANLEFRLSKENPKSLINLDNFLFLVTPVGLEPNISGLKGRCPDL